MPGTLRPTSFLFWVATPTLGAIWAAVVEQNLFTVEAPGVEPVTATLGKDAQFFRGTITISGRKPICHLVAISAEL
jgi:hypothetical protein